MQVNYTTDAFHTLIRLVNYIESTNTQGAGLRWLAYFEEFLEEIICRRTNKTMQ